MRPGVCPHHRSQHGFNPRIPCGMRPILLTIHPRLRRFQSTHPVWDATILQGFVVAERGVSIHASRVGCDHPQSARGYDALRFNPRIPCGMRLYGYWLDPTPKNVSIHASRVGCDQDRLGNAGSGKGFNPRIPCGMRLPGPGRSALLGCFNPRIPCGMRLARGVGSKVCGIVSIHASRVGCDGLEVNS